MADGINDDAPIKLDYSLPNEERSALVQKIIDSLPPEKLSTRYLDTLAEYIIKPRKEDKDKNKEQKNFITQNRKTWLNKREVSYEGLASKFENGEDGIYNLITEDKNIIFTPKIEITQHDIDTVPGLKELREAIKIIELKLKAGNGNLKQLIEMRKDQYVLKGAYQKPITFLKAVNSFHNITIVEKIDFDEDNIPVCSNDSISLLNPQHVSVLLCNYDKIKEGCYEKFQSDIYYVLLDLEDIIDKVLKEQNPILFDILVDKIDKKTNEEIRQHLIDKHDVSFSCEYISSIWRKKIPTIIATEAQNQYLEWYYTAVEKGNWKRCSRCGKVKLSHNRFFSKNKTSKDGFYSICKECRNKKGGKR